MTKKYRAKQYPLYSIQISQNKGFNNYLKLCETSNIKDGTEPLADKLSDMGKFGFDLAESKLLTKGDKIALARMFEYYLNHYKNFLK